MGKVNIELKENTEKLIFTNSNNTFNTYSKTCSSLSKIFTKGLNLELKKDMPYKKFYLFNGKLKRDLSIETDICRMKRFCRKRMKKQANRLAAFEKCRYSLNKTDVDNSACGDSEPDSRQKTAHFNGDVSALVMENLKALLSDWIKIYLLENHETKEKIDTVLDSILHKLDLQTTDTSSSCTYTLDVGILNRKSAHITPKYANYFKQPRGSHCTVPLRGKRIKLISTLSIPRYLRKFKNGSLHDINSIRHKKLAIPIKRDRNCHTSSVNFLSISTSTLARHHATYRKCECVENIDDKWAMYRPLPSNATLHLTKSKVCKDQRVTRHRNEEIDRKFKLNVANIYKNIYTDPMGVTEIRQSISTTEATVANSQAVKSTENCSTVPNTQFSRTKKLEPKIEALKQKHNNSILRINFRDQTIEVVDVITDKDMGLEVKNKIKSNNLIANKKCKFRKKKIMKKSTERRNKLIHVLEKTELHSLKEKALFDRFQTVFKYFKNNTRMKNIQFDLHINLYPDKGKEKIDEVERKKTDIHDPNRNRSKESKIISTAFQNNYKQEPFSSKPNIIPLLDGAVSHANYLISKETTEDNRELIKSDNNNSTIPLMNIDIAKEINDLRSIVKDLAATAEKFVKLHLSKTSKHNDVKNSKIRGSEIKGLSKGIQISIMTPKSDIISGVKLKKAPKKKITDESSARLMKKSTSYRIIDSETILRVTDMTSAAADIIAEEVAGAESAYSIPKSKFDTSSANKQNLLAFYCDEFIKPDCAYDFNRRNTFCSSIQCPSRNNCFHLKPSYSDHNCYQDRRNDNALHYKLMHSDENCTNCCEDRNSCSSVCVEICNKQNDKTLMIRSRSISFIEGCFYCILLWIPVFVILWLFYTHILKDRMNSAKDTRSMSLKAYNKINSSQFPLTLSDLGF